MAKYALVRAGIAQGSTLAIIAVVCALLASLITLYALLSVWRDFFWGKADKTQPIHPVPDAQQAPAYVASALVAGLSLFAGPLFTHAEATTRELRDQQHYIRSILGDRPVIIPPEPQGNELLKEKGGTH